MAVFWVQSYFTLPFIFEDIGMSDEPTQGRQHPQISDNDTSAQSTSNPSMLELHDVLTLSGPPPIHSLPAPGTQSFQQPAMEFDLLPGQHLDMYNYRGSSFMNMAGMASALPNYPLRGYVQQPFHHQYTPAGPPPSITYHHQQGAQFAGQTAPNFTPIYEPQYQMPYPQPSQPRAHGTYAQYSPAIHPAQGGAQSFPTPGFYQQPPAGLQALTTNFPPQNPAFFQSPPPTQYLVPHGARIAGFQGPVQRAETNPSFGLGMSSNLQMPPQSEFDSKKQLGTLSTDVDSPQQEQLRVFASTIRPQRPTEKAETVRSRTLGG